MEYHAHRSPLVIEKVEAGIFDIGICSGKTINPRSIISEGLSPEELVLVADSPKKFKIGKQGMSIMAIEFSSSTWKSVQAEIKKRKLVPQKEMESFFSIGQLAKAGHEVGLVPLGVAETLGFKQTCIQHFKPKLFRPIQLVYKKSRLDIPGFADLIEELKKIKQS